MIYFYILAIFSHKYKIKLAMTKTHSCTNNLPDNSEQQKRLLVSRLYDNFLIHLPLHEFGRVNRIISHRKENFLFPFQSFKVCICDFFLYVHSIMAFLPRCQFSLHSPPCCLDQKRTIQRLKINSSNWIYNCIFGCNLTQKNFQLCYSYLTKFWFKRRFKLAENNFL